MIVIIVTGVTFIFHKLGKVKVKSFVYNQHTLHMLGQVCSYCHKSGLERALARALDRPLERTPEGEE